MSDMIEAVKELTKVVKDNQIKSGADFERLEGEAKQKYEQLDAIFEKQEAENQKLVKEINESRQKTLDMEEQIKGLEAKLTRMPKGEDREQVSAELKQFMAHVVSGEALEAKTLNTVDDTQGGVLVPAEYDSMIAKNITEISALRSVARVRRTTSFQFKVPRRTSNLSASWVGERATRSTTEQAYGVETINVNSLTALVPVTTQMLMSEAFDMESEINLDAAEAFANAEGAAFISGTGNQQPTGILTDSSISSRTSENNDAITATDVINLSGDLKTGYSPVYALNRQTLAYIRGLTDTNGGFLWGSGLQSGLPNTINGYSYVIEPNLANVADGTVPVLFGDFMRGYTIVDKVGMSMIRDPFTRKNEGIVEFSFERFVGGKVILPEAIKKLTVQ